MAAGTLSDTSRSSSLLAEGDGGSGGGRAIGCPLGASASGGGRVSRQAQVVPGARLVFEVAQKVGRVIGDDQRHALVAVDAPAQPADGLVAAQEALHCEA